MAAMSALGVLSQGSGQGRRHILRTQGREAGGPAFAEGAMTTAENIKSLPGGDKEEPREDLTLHFLNAIADAPGGKMDTAQDPEEPPPTGAGRPNDIACRRRSERRIYSKPALDSNSQRKARDTRFIGWVQLWRRRELTRFMSQSHECT